MQTILAQINNYKREIMFVIILITINYLLPLILDNALQIDQKYYLNYLLFFNILIIFYVLLPGEKDNIFSTI